MQFLGITSELFATLLFALGGALVLMYLFRLRRRRVQVPYGALWRRVLVRRQTRSLWHRLKRLMSLLLQLAILLLLLFALRDPRPEDETLDVRHLVLVVDTSASMAARDVSGGRDRLEAAREAALAVWDELRPADHVLLLRMDSEVRPLTDFGRPTALGRQGLVELEVTATSADLPGALAFAARALAGRSRPELVLVTDGAFPADALEAAAAVSLPPATEARVIPVGQARGNVAIAAFNARRYPLDRRNYEVFVQVASTFEAPVTVELTLSAGGRAVDQRQLELPPQGTIERFFPNLARGHRRLEARVRIVGGDQNDYFAMDDVAYALLPEDQPLRVLLVSEANLFLEAPLLLSPGVTLTTWRPSERGAPSPESMAAFDVVVTNGAVPPLPEAGNFLIVSPSGASSPIPVDGTAANPIIDRVATGDPLLRYIVGLDHVNIARAARFRLGRGDVAVARAIGGDAMIARRSGDARRVVGVAFSIEASDLGLRAAWPLLVLNALDWLTGDEASLLETVPTGRAARVFVSEPGVEAAWVRAPGGEVHRVEVVDRHVLVYPALPGFYDLVWETPARARLSTEALERAVAAGELAADQVVAANLHAPDDREIGPAAELPFERREAPEETTRLSFLAGREPWTVLVLVAIALLLFEWFTYHRRMTV
jgi:hypothetical protein